MWVHQTIYDEKEGKYMVYYSLQNKDDYLTIYYSYANKDFTSLSEPKKLIDCGSSIIDADIVKHDNLYHMFLAGIWKMTAPDIKGPWSPLEKHRQTRKLKDPVYFK